MQNHYALVCSSYNAISNKKAKITSVCFRTYATTLLCTSTLRQLNMVRGSGKKKLSIIAGILLHVYIKQVTFFTKHVFALTISLSEHNNANIKLCRNVSALIICLNEQNYVKIERRLELLSSACFA